MKNLKPPSYKERNENSDVGGDLVFQSVTVAINLDKK